MNCAKEAPGRHSAESIGEINSPDWDIELESLPARIESGIYNAQVVRISKIERKNWRRTYLQFRFKLCGIGPENDIELPGFCNYPKGKVSPYSKLGQWTRMLSEFSAVRQSKISLKLFGNFLFSVRVETVLKGVVNEKGKKDLPEHVRYEVVTDILAVVGRIDRARPHPEFIPDHTNPSQTKPPSGL